MPKRNRFVSISGLLTTHPDLLHVLNSRLGQHPQPSVTPAGLQGDGRICYPCPVMDKLTEDAVREIEQIHSSWIKFEVAGEYQSLLELCADDIELWPPNAQPVLGCATVSAQLAHETTRIHGIEISDRRIRGSNEIAYLTASYRTTFSSAEDEHGTEKSRARGGIAQDSFLNLFSPAFLWRFLRSNEFC